MKKFSDIEEQQTQDPGCLPCKAKQKKLSILVAVNQFKNPGTQTVYNDANLTKLGDVLKSKANFTELQVLAIVESIKNTPLQDQLIYVGVEQDAIDIYNALLNLGIEAKVSSNSIQKF